MLDSNTVKTCCQCKEAKPLECFARDKLRPGGLAYRCKDCQRIRSREHYRDNKANYLDASNRTKYRLRTDIQMLKATTPCTDCKKHYPYYVMHYDHTGTDKEADINHMVNQKRGRAAVMAEIAKCDVVCANCHAIRTYNRMYPAV